MEDQPYYGPRPRLRELLCRLLGHRSTEVVSDRRPYRPGLPGDTINSTIWRCPRCRLVEREQHEVMRQPGVHWDPPAGQE